MSGKLEGKVEREQKELSYRRRPQLLPWHGVPDEAERQAAVSRLVGQTIT